MKDPNIVGAGDVGLLDLPYLFRGLDKEQLFLKLHELFSTFPGFAAEWIKRPIITSSRLNTGCVIDIPLLYGGFAAYRPEAFWDIEIPDWIHSADIWLSVYARQNQLQFRDMGNWQFNRQIQPSKGTVHLAGPKLDAEGFSRIKQDYLLFLEHLCN